MQCERLVWSKLWNGTSPGPRRSRRLILDSVFLGVVGALAAQLFTVMLHVATRGFLVGLAGYVPPGLPEEGGTLAESIGRHGLLLIPLSTTLGAILTGVLIYTFAPEAEGHGTDTAVKAFHRLGGYVRERVPFLKMVASAITIGSGGAAGREGPTALIAAGIGSAYATITRRGDADRRLLLLMGMAAGLSAIFRSPIGSAVFAIEVLYRQVDLEAGAFLYTMLASIVAYALNGVFVGWHPLFVVPAGLGASGHSGYEWYALLGLLAGVVGTLLPIAFYGFRDLFNHVPVPLQLKPAVGGALLGVLALALPQVLGGGYGWIQEAIDGKLVMSFLLILIGAKILAFSFTVSSGGSGGVFAPSLFVGAMLGGFVAALLHQPPAALVIVGMAAVFGAAARVPIASLLMVTEMTGGYALLVPAALAVTVSCLVQASLAAPFHYQSLYEAQVGTRLDSPAHELEHLRGALRLLRERGRATKASLGKVDLARLVESGVDVGLTDDVDLDLVTLSGESPWVGKRLDELLAANHGEMVWVLVRDGHPTECEPSTRLEPGDRVLVLHPMAAAVSGP